MLFYNQSKQFFEMAKKNKKLINDFKSKFPVIWRMTRTAVETAVEIQDKENVLAFLNNAGSFGIVALNADEIPAEAMKYYEDAAHKQQLRDAIKEQFKGEDAGLIEIIFDHVAPLVFVNIGGGFALAKAIKEYNENNDQTP